YCFDLGVVPESQHDLVVRLNGEVIEHVERGGDEPGWSWVAGRSDICLEGGLRKALGDRFEIFVIESEPSQ
ncbi:hypothetical protein KAI87_17960, partial [Myxococcota bacterium]|nr:hypothetical protein [Myxococcota bacterium]